jgi:hypothetical protein
LPEPEYLIPPLMELLHDKYSFARFYAACALDCSCFGDKLKPWVPDIQKLLGDPDESVRQSGSNLLQIIDLSPSTNAVKSPGTAPALSVTTTGTSPIASEPADLREAKAHLAELREDYGEQHVEAQAALARVKELERLTKEEPNIPAELRAAKAHLAELRMEYGERYSEVRAALARIKALEENYRPSVVTNSSLTMPRKQ